jgi:hypothetical protein
VQNATTGSGLIALELEYKLFERMESRDEFRFIVVELTLCMSSRS